MEGFKKWLLKQESYGTSGGLSPPAESPGGLSASDIRKGFGSALGVSRTPKLDDEPPNNVKTPTRKSSRYVKEREADIFKM